jgi:hypothetical protein
MPNRRNLRLKCAGDYVNSKVRDTCNEGNLGNRYTIHLHRWHARGCGLQHAQFAKTGLTTGVDVRTI